MGEICRGGSGWSIGAGAFVWAPNACGRGNLSGIVDQDVVVVSVHAMFVTCPTFLTTRTSQLPAGTNYVPDESILDPQYAPPEKVRSGAGLGSALRATLRAAAALEHVPAHCPALTASRQSLVRNVAHAFCALSSVCVLLPRVVASAPSVYCTVASKLTLV